MSELYRITERADGRFLPEVRRHWWMPWNWEPINKEGRTVEIWDYGGEKTNEAAMANCRLYANLKVHVPKGRYFDFNHYA